MQLKVQLFNYFCKDLKDVWNNFQRLNDDDYYVFQTYVWMEYWFNSVGIKNYSMLALVVAVFDNDDVIAIFPLGMYKKLGVRIIEFIGGDQADYNTPIVSSKINLEDYMVMWTMVLNELPHYDILDLKRIPHNIMDRDNFFVKVICAKKTGSTYLLKLPVLPHLLSSVVSKRLLKDNARMFRRLSELGEVKFSISSNHDEYDSVIETTLKQKSNRYLLTGVRNILDDHNIFLFYKGLYNALNKSLNIHLSSLTFNDEVLATHLGVVYAKRFYYLMPTFSTGKFEKYSPGRLLLEYLVNKSIEEKLEIYDFTVGSEAYKKKWCDHEMNIYNHKSYSTVRGFLFLLISNTILFFKSNPTTRLLLTKLNRLINRMVT